MGSADTCVRCGARIWPRETITCDRCGKGFCENCASECSDGKTRCHTCVVMQAIDRQAEDLVNEGIEWAVETSIPKVADYFGRMYRAESIEDPDERAQARAEAVADLAAHAVEALQLLVIEVNRLRKGRSSSDAET